MTLPCRLFGRPFGIAEQLEPWRMGEAQAVHGAACWLGYPGTYRVQISARHCPGEAWLCVASHGTARQGGSFGLGSVNGFSGVRFPGTHAAKAVIRAW